MKIIFSLLEPPIELTRLDVNKGAEFIFKTWKYGREYKLSEFQTLITTNESSGVYVNGEPVSGITMSRFGLMSMLYTLKEYRNKNYGSLCMQGLMKDMAAAGLIPTSVVEVNNEAAIKFHEKIGMKFCQVVDYVVYEGPGN